MSHTIKENDNKSQVVTKNVTYNDIASKLLQDKLLLTALELHTELVESGRELKQLKDFFSNPGNFELQTQEVPSRLCKYQYLIFRICIMSIPICSLCCVLRINEH